MATELDALTRKITAFESFKAMLDTASQYRPTLRPFDRDHTDLADAYDAAQASRGDARRAYRGGSYVLPEPDASPEGQYTVSLAGVPAGSGMAAEWQRVIWAMNGERYKWDASVQLISSPGDDSHHTEDGAWVEEYPDIRLITRHTRGKDPEDGWYRVGRGPDEFERNYGVIQAKSGAASALLFAAVNEVRGNA